MTKTIQFSKLMAIALFSAFAITSCGGDEESNLKHSTRFNMISAMEDVAMIGSVDIIKLIEKSDFENHPDLPDEAKMAYTMMVENKLESSGINLSGNNHFAVSFDDNGEPNYVCVTAKVTDQEKVRGVLKELINGTYTTEESGSREYHFLSEDEVVVAWDEKDVIFVTGPREKDYKTIAKDLLDARFTDAEDNQPLEDYLEQTDDINFYMDGEKILNLAKMGMGQMGNSGMELSEEHIDAMKGSYYISTGNFNDGSIVFESHIHADNYKNSAYNIFGDAPIAPEFMNYITDDKVLFFATASLNMNAMVEAMKMAESKYFDFSKGLEKVGLTEEQVKNVLSGEFSFSLVDIMMQEKTYSYTEATEAISAEDYDLDELNEEAFFEETTDTYSQPIPQVVITCGVNDADVLRDLLTTKAEATIKDGYFVADNDGPFIVITDDKLILTMDTATAKFFAEGNAFKPYNLPGGMAITNPIFGFYNTDLSTLPDGVKKLAEDEGEEGQMLLEFLDLFEKITFDGSFDHMVLEAKLKDGSQNSLKILTDQVIQMVVKEMGDSPFM